MMTKFAFLNRFALRNPRVWEIFKFLFVGGIATIIDYLAMSLVLYCFNPSAYADFVSIFFGSYIPSVTASVTSTGIGFVCGLSFNYIFSLLFVFKNSDTSRAKGILGFTAFSALAVCGLAIHLLGMFFGTAILRFDEWLVKITLTLVVLVFNYLTRKKLLFKDIVNDKNQQ